LPVTLIDIARETGTSVSTVSRVLSGGAAAQRISAETRGRVLAAASKLGYRPNLLARSLRTRKSNTIALLLSDVGNPFFGQIASLIEQSLHRQGYSLLVCNSGEDPNRESEYLELLPRKGIDGLIIVVTAADHHSLTEHLGADLPIVLLDREVAGFNASVTSDQEQAANALCDALQRVGVRRVVLASGPSSIVTHKRRAAVIRKRLHVVAEHEGSAMSDTGRHAFIKFLSAKFDAIVCTNNNIAHGFIDSIEQIDQPPVVACFDDMMMMHLLPIPIVSSVQDIARLAEGCVSLLMPQLQGHANGNIRPIVIPTRLVTNLAFKKLRHAS
jgi:LacI family transcriptional regulator